MKIYLLIRFTLQWTVAGLLFLLACALNGCTPAPDRSVTITINSRTVPEGDTLSIAGNQDAFGNWIPGTILLERRSATVWERTFTLKEGTDAVFKITRGSWQTEALDERGPQYTAPQTFRVTGDTSIMVSLDRWMDRNGDTTALTPNDITMHNGFWIANGWRYHSGDDSTWRNSSFNDSAWEIANTYLFSINRPLTGWNTIGWFRLNLDVDSSLWNVPLAMNLWQVGASEVYLDGKLLYRFGEVGHSKDEEVSFEDRNPNVIMFGPGRHHVLAVRYSNATFADYSWSRFERMRLYAGFEIALGGLNGTIARCVAQAKETSARQWIFTAIPLSFGFLHFILFLFYPKFRENLYYALCMVGFAGITFASNEIANTDSVRELLRWTSLAQVFQMLTIVFGLFFFYSFLYKKIPVRILFFLIPAVGLAAWSCVETSILFYNVKDAFTIIVLLAMSWWTFRTWKHDIEGASIIAWGFIILVVTVFYGLLVDYRLILPFAGIRGDAYVFGALALSTSMSMFLSRRFARTNRDLELRLEEVRELSERALLQERQARETEVERRVLEADNFRKTKELEEARTLQLSLLPGVLPDLPDFDIAVLMKTATEVGGDYYDFAVAPDGALTVAVGDATGHGTKAGMMVVVTKSLFHDFARHADLREIFEKYTDSIKRLNLPSLYMAMVLVRIRNNTLAASSAGMPPPLIYRAATGEVEEMTLKGMPLGGFFHFPYEEKEVTLQPGDTVVLMSDGYTEMFNSERETLGDDRVKQLVREAGAKRPKELIDHLLKAGEAWANGKAQEDDVTFVVLQMKQD